MAIEIQNLLNSLPPRRRHGKTTMCNAQEQHKSTTGTASDHWPRTVVPVLEARLVEPYPVNVLLQRGFS